MSSEKFRFAAGFEATHVPYRGGSEVIADILGGRIDFYFCPLATALPLIREGQVRALVVSTAKRAADLPDVPTPGRYRTEGCRQRDLVRRVGAGENAARHCRQDACGGLKVLADPAMQESLKKLGVEPMPMTPAEMDELVRRELAADMELVKAAGIKQ